MSSEIWQGKSYKKHHFNLKVKILGQAWAISINSDHMLQNAAYDQGLHCLQLIFCSFAHINMK